MAEQLTIATLRGGDVDGLSVAGGPRVVWVDLDGPAPDEWDVLCESATAAEAIAENCDAELVRVDEWDGSAFGDGACGAVESPRPGVIVAPRSAPCDAPAGWRVEYEGVPSYCSQNAGDCATCSLVSYGRDCRNVALPAGVRR